MKIGFLFLSVFLPHVVFCSSLAQTECQAAGGTFSPGRIYNGCNCPSGASYNSRAKKCVCKDIATVFSKNQSGQGVCVPLLGLDACTSIGASWVPGRIVGSGSCQCKSPKIAYMKSGKVFCGS